MAVTVGAGAEVSGAGPRPPRWLKVAAIVGVALTWFAGATLTVVLLAVLHGPYSAACQVPGQDSEYGTAEISWVPLGLRCTYPEQAAVGRPVPDGPGPGLGHLLVELYLVAVPVGFAIGIVRWRRARKAGHPSGGFATVPPTAKAGGNP